MVGPKWHKALHLPKQIDQCKGCLHDTFCNERHHQIPKGFSECYKGNLHGLEKYVLSRTLAYHRDALSKFKECPCLVGPPSWNEELGAYVANAIQCNGLQVAAGDFVISNTKEVVEVKVCGRSGRNLFLLGDACDVVHTGMTSMRVKRVASLRLIWIIDNTSVAGVKCWKEWSSPDRVQIIH